jgi:hypothetical protein
MAFIIFGKEAQGDRANKWLRMTQKVSGSRYQKRKALRRTKGFSQQIDY